MSDILKIEDLVIETVPRYAGDTTPIKRLVDGVSLTLKRGEVLGLIGESGAGKTTIGLSALSYTRPGSRISGGRILFEGQDLLHMSPEAVRRLRGERVAYIAQSAAASFNPAMRLGNQVAETGIRHGTLRPDQAKEHAKALFAELSLPDPSHFGHKFPHQVSGGQLQRAMSAMAICCSPGVLVLDEPTTALDVTTQIDVLIALRKLIRDHNASALYISHDLAVVAQVADRIMVLRHGKVVEEGTTDQIINRPHEPYTQALIAARAADELQPFRPAANSDQVPVLECRNVTASYRLFRKVVKDVSFTVNRGETVALVGESGSGKTSLARLVCGMMDSYTGSVSLSGEVLPATIRQRSKDQLRRVQMVYQLPDMALNPRQSIGKIIGRAISFYATEKPASLRAEVEELLRMVDLKPEIADRLPRDLSGGQKQRVCIARALAAKPDLLVCDEVTSALDTLVAEEVLKLLERLQKEMGLGILFITHDLGLVRRTTNRMLVLLKGEVVANGPTAEVFHPPHHPYTESLLSSVPQMRIGWLDERIADHARSDTSPAPTAQLRQA